MARRCTAGAIGASLLARSFVRLVRVDNGYTAGGVLIATVELPPGASAAPKPAPEPRSSTG